MHDLLNITPFQVGLGLCLDREGRQVAAAVVKASFRFDAAGKLEPAEPAFQLPVMLADEHFGDPAVTSVRYASDVVPTRDGTDVAVVGHAYGRRRTAVEASVRVGALEKTLLVSGPRYAVVGGTAIAGPLAFEKLPLRYELAYGGTLEDPGAPPVPFQENPVGLGFARTLPERAPLPSVEYPDSRWGGARRPRPAGLGFVPMGWRQRARFGGTYDAAWERERRPLLPEDLDDRFWNAVPEDQVLRPKLQGGEPILLRNLHPEAETVVLAAPRLAFTIAFHVKDAVQVVPAVADTLLLEPDLGRLSLTYRASLLLGDDLLRLRRVVFRPLPP